MLVIHTSIEKSYGKIFQNFIKYHNQSWLRRGDFNEISNSPEKFGGAPTRINRSFAFNNCINNINMIDLGFPSSRLTWTNKPKTHQPQTSNNKLIMECLDKFYANHAWVNLFQDSHVTHLLRTHSDHCAMILNLTKTYSKPNSNVKLETLAF